MGCLLAVIALHIAEYNHGKSRSVLQCVRQMLTTPSIIFVSAAPHPKELDQTLPKSYRIRNRNEQGNYKSSSTHPIRLPGARLLRREEHTIVDVYLRKNFGITRQCIRQEHISELPILRLCQPSQTDSSERSEKPTAPISRKTVEREEEYDQD